MRLQRRTFSFAALVVAFGALAGCANTPGYTLKGLEVTDAANAGRIVGSIAFSLDGDPDYMSYEFSFRKRGGAKNESGFIAVGNTAFDKESSYDVVETVLKGKTFNVRLPAGDYEIFQVHMSSDTGQARTAFSAREPFSVPFSVAPGEVVYLGQFLHRGDWGKNLFGLSVPGNSWFVVSDQSARDLPLIHARDPAVETSNAVVRLPVATGVASAFIRAPK